MVVHFLSCTVLKCCCRNHMYVEWLTLTFAWPSVVQMKSVTFLGSLQVAFGGKKFT